MHRISRVLAAAAAVLVVGGTPALAQYEPTSTTQAPTTTSTTQAPATTSTTAAPLGSTTSTSAEPSTTTTTAPPPKQESIRPSNASPAPGETVQVTAPASRGGVTITSEDQLTTLITSGSGASVAAPEVSVTRNTDGTVTVSVQVPPDTPPGVYFISVVVTRPTGTRTLIVPITVKPVRPRAAAAFSIPAQRGVAGVDFWVDLPVVATPPEVAAIQQTITSVGEEEAIARAVVDDGADLEVIDGQLVLNSTPIDDVNDDARPLVAALAVGLAGGGLVLLRRRTPVGVRKGIK